MQLHTAARYYPRDSIVKIAGSNHTESGPLPSVTLAPEHAREPLNGRLLLLLSVDPSKEPRFQIEEGTKSQQVFGIDARAWTGREPQVFDSKVLGYPRLSLADVPAGTYRVQALLHRYETSVGRMVM